MEIKHTIEILTKDIQDIEKLVRNLNNYTTVPQIELDLAMSKLRRVYELLSMISSDSKNDQPEEVKAADKHEEVIEQDDLEETSEEETIIEETNLEEPAVEETDVEEIDASSIEPEPVPDELREVKAPEVGFLDFPSDEDNPDELKEAEALPLEDDISEESIKTQKQPKGATILAEKFEIDKSLNEKIAPGINTDFSSKIKGGPIDTIKRNIGINDRFLIIRELMNGDNEGFNQLIQKLDECTNFNEAFKHIESRFPDNLEHDGVKILINLSRRKFISRGNV
ncbi:hypothetical protein ACFLRQ_01730 [Bacteroidota bacterium]